MATTKTPAPAKCAYCKKPLGTAKSVADCGERDGPAHETCHTNANK